MALSYDGSYLLSNSMDNTLRIWDVRPFAPSERCVKLLSGHQHNFEKNLLRCAWSPDGSKVFINKYIFYPFTPELFFESNQSSKNCS